MSKTTDNYRKHTTKSALQRLLINNFYRVFLKEAKKLRPVTVLDVGCGEGFTLNRMKHLKIGKELEGVDFLKTAVDLGNKQFPFLKLKQGDIYKLPYKDNTFDLVICSEVLEHLERPADALAELERVSKKHVLFSVPNEPFFMLGNFFRGKNVSRLGNDIEHIQHWSKSKFTKFIATRFKVVTVRTPLPWTVVVGRKIKK